MPKCLHMIKKTKKNFYILIILFTIPLFIDQVSKHIILNNLYQIQELSEGTFNISLIKNYGVISGYFDDIPQSILRVVISSYGAFIIAFFLALQYILQSNILAVRASITVIFSGIVGNLIDRIQLGYVIDFINITGQMESYHFNFADIVQWPGFIYLVMIIILKPKVLWPDDDRRNRLLISSDQYKFLAVKFISIVMFSIILWIGTYTYLSEIVSEYNIALSTSDKILNSFTLIHVSLSTCYFIFFMWISLRESHKFIGPILALKKYVNNICSNNLYHENLRLRTSDYLKDIEEISKSINTIKFDKNKQP